MSEQKKKNLRNGNQFWKARTTHGRKKIIKDSETLWESACQYFEWADKTPLFEHKPMVVSGVVEDVNIEKLRAYTQAGLCIFLDISEDTYREFAKKDYGEGFSEVKARIDSIIYQQKFSGASAGLLNPNIIARDLGLRDRTDTEISGKDGQPIGIESKGFEITFLGMDDKKEE